MLGICVRLKKITKYLFLFNNNYKVLLTFVKTICVQNLYFYFSYQIYNYYN